MCICKIACKIPLPFTEIYAHVHTCIYAYKRIYMCIRMHIYAYIHIDTHAYVCPYMLVNPYVCTNLDAGTCTNTITCGHGHKIPSDC